MKIYSDIDLTDFEFWSGAKDNVELLTDEEINTIQEILEECNPDGMDETQVNDFFWFDTDIIAEWLGYQDWEELFEERDR